MNRKRSKLVQVMLVSLAVIGLLVAAWPGVAQDEKPPLKPEMRRFLEERTQKPGSFQKYMTDAQTKNPVSTPELATWQSEVVDGGRTTSRSFTLDIHDEPHVAYSTNTELRYAYRDPSGWHIEIVDGRHSQWASLALDQTNRPAISYCVISDNFQVTLMFAYYDGTLWHIETVDNSSDDVGRPSVVALTSTGEPRIVYNDDDHRVLKYAYRGTDGWHTQVIGSAWVGDISITMDKSDQLHLAYLDLNGNIVRYGVRNATGWHFSTIDSGNLGHFVSLSLNQQELPNIVYYDGTSQGIKYASYNGTLWQTQFAFSATGPGENSLSIDLFNRPHIAYREANSVLKYAYYSGTDWKVKFLGSDSGVSIALDRLQRAHVTFSSQNTVNYASYFPGMSDGADLAFASYRDNNWEVYTARADGIDQTRHTVNPAYDSTPKLNRGANRVAFVSDRNGNNEIYVMNADGLAQTRLTNTPAQEYWPTWSPDGPKIAFYSYRDGNAEIYVMNANGSNPTRLTNSPAWDGHPTWSPDGAQIVFASDRSGSDDLWIMNASGTNQHQLTFGLNAVYPAWSPDGSRIIFNDDTNNDGWLDIAIISVDGTGLTHPLGYSPTNYDYATPVWSPSGQDYAFSKIQWIYYQGNYYWVDAYLYSVVAGSIQQLTSSGLDWWPHWQTTDVWLPTSQVTALPALFNTMQFTVEWSGTDVGGAGIMSCDIQYRDNLTGSWVNWLSGTTQTSATFSGTNGHTYYFRSRARDSAGNLESYPGGNGDTHTTVDTIAPTSSASAPLHAASPQIPVTWGGADPVSGIASYDIQVRDGVGDWTDWLISTTNTSSVYPGQLGHTYYFQSRARDKAGNLELYPDGDGDTQSHTPLYVLNSQVLGNRDQFVAQAQAVTDPAALNQPKSDHLGSFSLYYNLSGTYSLTVTRDGFGSLPPMSNVVISDTSSNPIVYLPPLDNQISDSHFESGDLVAWNPIGDLTPTITSTAHTGNYATLLGGSVPTDTITTGPWHSTIEQTVNVPPTMVSGTLSLLYRVDAAEPLSDTLNAYLIGANSVLTFTLPITTNGWMHAWFDVSAWTEPTATLKIDLAVGDVGRDARIILDEITWGSAITGSYAAYLPVVRR